MNLTAKISKVIPADYSLKEIEFIIGGVKFLMKCIEGGTFMMGAQKSNVNESNYDSKAFDWESPIHSVSVGNYYIGETLVTQALWKAVMGHTPMPDNKQWNAQDGIGDNMPAYNISYIDAKKFAATLNSIPEIQDAGLTFRLPTEAEWEFACKGGLYSKGYRFSGSDNPEDVAWFDFVSEGKPHPVKEKMPNELGLYDMSGNLFEWCRDWYTLYKPESQNNPRGPETGSRRVLRGGCWNYSSRACRSAYRLNDSSLHADSYYGLRLVMTIN
ncbi:MAG: formylglycine-generating enzyme family protein [Bacteroidales bacterium]|nr:formylglycine-generating enzyme family protein [Bacteroidales bacterium]